MIVWHRYKRTHAQCTAVRVCLSRQLRKKNTRARMGFKHNKDLWIFFCYT